MLVSIIVEEHELLGINLLAIRNNIGTYVHQFYRKQDAGTENTALGSKGCKLAAERSALISIGDLVYSVNQHVVIGCSLEQTKAIVASAGRPMVITFYKLMVSPKTDPPVSLARSAAMSLLSDVRRLDWVSEYYARLNRDDRLLLIKFTYNLYKIKSALQSLRKISFQLESPTSPAIPVQGASTADPIDLELDVWVCSISRWLCQDISNQSMFPAYIMDIINGILGMTEYTNLKSSDFVSFVTSAYDRIYPLFQQVVEEYASTTHYRRMNAYFSLDAYQPSSIDEIAESTTLDSLVQPFFYVSCCQANWDQIFQFYVHFRQGSINMTLVNKILPFVLQACKAIFPVLYFEETNKSKLIHQLIQFIHLYIHVVGIPTFQRTVAYDILVSRAETKPHEVWLLDCISDEDELEINLNQETSQSDMIGKRALQLTPKDGDFQLLLRKLTVPNHIAVHRREIERTRLSRFEPHINIALFQSNIFPNQRSLNTTRIIGDVCRFDSKSLQLTINHTEADKRCCLHSIPLFQYWVRNEKPGVSIHNYVTTLSKQAWYGCTLQIPIEHIDEKSQGPINCNVCQAKSTQTKKDYVLHPGRTMSSMAQCIGRNLGNIMGQLVLFEDDADAIKLAPQDMPELKQKNINKREKNIDTSWSDYHSEKTTQQSNEDISPEHRFIGISIWANFPTLSTLRELLSPVTGIRSMSRFHGLFPQLEEYPKQNVLRELSAILNLDKSTTAKIWSHALEVGRRSLDVAPDIDYKIIAHMMTPELISTVAVAAMLEYKIVVITDVSLAAVSMMAELIKTAISPLSWCHVFAPTISPMCLDILECPMPYIVGLPSKQLVPCKSMCERRLVIDVDTGTFELEGDIDIIANPIKDLKSAIIWSLQETLLNSDKPLFSNDNSVSDNVLQTCRRFILDLLKGVESCCISTKDNKELIILFDTELFAQTKQSHGYQARFWTEFVQSQAFSHYLTKTPL